MLAKIGPRIRASAPKLWATPRFAPCSCGEEASEIIPKTGGRFSPEPIARSARTIRISGKRFCKRQSGEPDGENNQAAENQIRFAEFFHEPADDALHKRGDEAGVGEQIADAIAEFFFAKAETCDVLPAAETWIQNR